MSDLYAINHQDISSRFSRLLLYSHLGKVDRAVGLTLEADLPGASLGSICELNVRPGKDPVLAEVVGFRDNKVVLMPLSDVTGINRCSEVKLVKREATVKVGSELLGRVLDGAGNPIDNGPELAKATERSIYADVINPLDRAPIKQPIDLGVRALNGMLTCGQGQRMGVMAGSGVGKSVLLGMMARYTNADINVIALVGERGREVREYIEKDLGPEGLKKSVVVVATSDQSPLLRMRAAYVATTIAEHFADSGKNVLLMMDSLTRFCMAQREIGLSMHEPPTAKGYTPSVFSQLPKLLERAGNREIGKGSITGLYTVLVEGDDLDDPIADSARSILDGHIVLSRKLADKGHFPAIDILASVSRVMRHVVDPEHYDISRMAREMLATYSEAEDLINIGAYVSGTNAKLDRAIYVHELLENFLRQDVEDRSTIAETNGLLRSILRGDH